MTDSTAAFSKLVPGFDFLQGLVKNAGAALPGVGQWVAPTLDPEELSKRIEELRTVQFWLEQNARMLATTIQALEVQRMTLSTLKTMNVQMSDLHESMKIHVPPAPSPAPAAATPATPAARARTRAARKAAAGTAPAPAGVVDPTQWWGALTKQFTELAAGALQESQRAAAKPPAGGGAKPTSSAATKTAAQRTKASLKPAGDAAQVANAKRRAPRR